MKEEKVKVGVRGKKQKKKSSELDLREKIEALGKGRETESQCFLFFPVEKTIFMSLIASKKHNPARRREEAGHQERKCLEHTNTQQVEKKNMFFFVFFVE